MGLGLEPPFKLPRGLVKIQTARTHPRSILFRRSGVGPMDLHLWQVPWWCDVVGPGPLLEDQLPRGLSFMHPNLSPCLGFAFTAQMGDESERKSSGRFSWGLGKDSQGVSTRWPWAYLFPAVLEVHDFRDEMDCSDQNPFTVKGKEMNPVGGSNLTRQPGQSHGDLNLPYLPQ